MTTGKATDDFEAVRQIVATLEPFNSPEDLERILRWAREKLRMPISDAGSAGTEAGLGAAGLPPGTLPSAVDIKTFVDQKDPKAD